MHSAVCRFLQASNNIPVGKIEHAKPYDISFPAFIYFLKDMFENLPFCQDLKADRSVFLCILLLVLWQLNIIAGIINDSLFCLK
ncbi:Uncharacterised protein [Mycobacteroides abscessus subsp. abscessus]|nr:Uncharacterised protein [Mycobacteroides abscessus subsp. abscessus]